MLSLLGGESEGTFIETGRKLDLSKTMEAIELCPVGIKTLADYLSSAASLVKVFAPETNLTHQISDFYASSTTEQGTNFASTVQNVADVAKCITIIGSTFQVVALLVTVAEMVMEVHRGSKILPRILDEANQLRRVIIMSIIQVLDPRGAVKAELLQHMSRTQEEAL